MQIYLTLVISFLATATSIYSAPTPPRDLPTSHQERSDIQPRGSDKITGTMIIGSAAGGIALMGVKKWWDTFMNNREMDKRDFVGINPVTFPVITRSDSSVAGDIPDRLANSPSNHDIRDIHNLEIPSIDVVAVENLTPPQTELLRTPPISLENPGSGIHGEKFQARRDIGTGQSRSTELYKRVIPMPKPNVRAWGKLVGMVSETRKPINEVLRNLVKYIGDGKTTDSVLKIFLSGTVAGAGLITFLAYLDEFDAQHPAAVDFKHILPATQNLKPERSGNMEVVCEPLDSCKSALSANVRPYMTQTTIPNPSKNLPSDKKGQIYTALYSESPMSRLEKGIIENRIYRSYLPQSDKSDLLRTLEDIPLRPADNKLKKRSEWWPVITGAIAGGIGFSAGGIALQELGNRLFGPPSSYEKKRDLPQELD